MGLLQEKVVRHTVRDVLATRLPDISKDETREIAFFIMSLSPKSVTATQAAIIRKLDSYHGVTEDTLLAGQALYAALYLDDED